MISRDETCIINDLYITLFILTFYDFLCFQKHIKVDDAELKRVREDLQNRIDYLRKQADVSINEFFILELF